MIPGQLGPCAVSSLEHLVKMMIAGTTTRNEAAVAIAKLGQLGEEKLVDILLQTSNRCGAQTRIAAAFGLGQLSLEVQQVLQILMEQDIPIGRADFVVEKLFEGSADPMPIQRRACLQALGSLGVKKEHRSIYLKPASLLSFFYTFLKDKDPKVRKTAAEMIAAQGSSGITEMAFSHMNTGELILIEAATKDSTPIIRQAAIHGLASLGAKSIRTIIMCLKDSHNSVKEYAGKVIQKVFKLSECNSNTYRYPSLRLPVLCQEDPMHNERHSFTLSTKSSMTGQNRIPMD